MVLLSNTAFHYEESPYDPEPLRGVAETNPSWRVLALPAEVGGRSSGSSFRPRACTGAGEGSRAESARLSGTSTAGVELRIVSC
jgi:hypothetical protein